MGTELFSDLKDVINTESSNGTRITSVNAYVKAGDIEAIIQLPKIESNPKRAEEAIRRAAAKTRFNAVVIVVEPIYQVVGEIQNEKDGLDDGREEVNVPIRMKAFR